MNTIYTARCVQCGAYVDRYAKIEDGTKLPHEISFYDDEGLTRGRPCQGGFVSVMGRTFEQVRAAEARIRSTEAEAP